MEKLETPLLIRVEVLVEVLSAEMG